MTPKFGSEVILNARFYSHPNITQVEGISKDTKYSSPEWILFPSLLSKHYYLRMFSGKMKREFRKQVIIPNN